MCLLQSTKLYPFDISLPSSNTEMRGFLHFFDEERENGARRKQDEKGAENLKERTSRTRLKVATARQSIAQRFLRFPTSLVF